MWNQIQREPFVRVEWTFLIHNHFSHFSFFISPVERSDYKRRMQKGGTRGCTRIAFPMQFFPLPCFPIFINHYITSHSSLYLCSSPYSDIFVYIFSTSIFPFLFEDSICSSGFQSPACLFPLPLTKLPLRIYLHAPQLRTHLEDVFHGKKDDFITRNADENIKQTVQWNDLITFSRLCALNIFLCSVAFSFNSTLAHPTLLLWPPFAISVCRTTG